LSARSEHSRRVSHDDYSNSWTAFTTPQNSNTVPVTHPEELGGLLSECHAAYLSARKNLLVSPLTEQIRGLDPTRSEFVKLVRFFFRIFSKPKWSLWHAGCSYLYLKQLCREETEPYRVFISSGKEQLYIRKHCATISTMICARASYMNPDGEIMSERELSRRVRARLQPVGVREVLMRPFICARRLDDSGDARRR